MITLHTRTHKFPLITFFLLLVCVLQAQNIKLSEYYYKQIEKDEFTFEEKEQLIDSLIKLPNITIDKIELAKIYYDLSAIDWKSNLKRSIYYVNKIQEIANEINNHKDDIFIKNHYNKVLFLSRHKKLYDAIDTSEKYIERYAEENRRLGKLYRLRGNIYSEIGDLQKSIDNYDRSIFILKSIELYDELIKTYISKSETYVNLNDLSYKEDILLIGNEFNKLLNQDSIKVEDRIAINLNLGSFYDFIEDFPLAKERYSEALNEAISINDSVKIGNSYMNLGILSKKENKFQIAEDLIKKSSFYLLDGKSMIFNNLADIYQKENNHKKALIHYQKAIVQALQSEAIDYQKLPSIEDIELSPDKLDILGYLIDKANGWVAYYDAEQNPEYLQKALETFTLADELIDVIYVESREDLSKLFWRKKSAAFYPKAVEVCYRLKQPEKAFSFMEKNKAILLLENITNATAKRLSKLPENILEREQNLIKNIKKLEAEIQESTENQTIETLKNKVFKYKKENAAFIDSLETNYPKYYNYKRNINIVTLKNVQSTLQTDELVLQYIVGKEKGFVALISPTTIQLKELPKTKILTKTVTQYKEAVSKPYVNNTDKANYETVAKKLYQQLIPFSNAEIELTKKRITIIADGILQYIPFEALYTPNNTYLIENTVIHYNYSLSAASQSQQNKTPISKTFIAIAPTKFKNDKYDALATSSAELKKLSNIFNANHFQYEEATKKRFTEAYGNYKIVHLSSHGGIDNNIPWMTFYDEKLTLDELYFTKNQSELVVLSACKTSDGELKKGEGVMSLARGFFNAGAKSVVSSLWDINEKASNDIIQEFYKNIIAGDTKSIALQKAKLTYIKNNKNTSEASPYYWSALTITGDITPISQNENRYLYYIFGAFILTGIIIYIRFKRRKQKAA